MSVRFQVLKNKETEHLNNQEGCSVPTTVEAPAFLFGRVPGRCDVSRICLPVGWLSRPGTETWWQRRQVSHHTDEVINNKTRWAGKERGGGGVIWAQHMHFPAVPRGQTGAAERQDMARRSWNLWFDICSVQESVRGQEEVFEGTAASLLQSESLGFIREIWLAGHGEWLSSVVPATWWSAL